MKRNRRQRGWILLAVLVVLLGLALAVTAFYTQSEAFAVTGTQMSAYQVAASRAELGAQAALASIRQSMVNVETLLDCGDPDPMIQCTGVNQKIAVGPVDSGLAYALKEGGGLQYRYVIYKRPALPGIGVIGANLNRYTIRGEGFYGYTLTSQNLFTSVVEMDIEVGKSDTKTCQDYECAG